MMTETTITWGHHEAEDDDDDDGCGYSDGTTSYVPVAPPAPDGEGWKAVGAGFASPEYTERGGHVRHVARDVPYIIWAREAR